MSEARPAEFLAACQTCLDGGGQDLPARLAAAREQTDAIRTERMMHLVASDLAARARR